MFHEGSLQSGIALAIQQQKLVTCFVRDDGPTSQEWEDEWLTSGWISSLLAQKAVLLRLQAGSTEAGFLAAFCDVTDTPTVVVIENGQLQVQLKSDVSKDEFTNAIRKVLGAPVLPGSSTARTPPTQASAQTPTEHRAPVEAEDDLYGAREAHTSSAHTPSAKAQGKQKATPTSESNTLSSNNKAQQEARDALRKKKREDADELARIKARIEADKAARKAEAELRKAERERERNTNAQSEVQSRATTSSKGSQAKNVNLNVRLFDGRTIRSTFPRTATLQDEVRSWVDEEFSKLSADDENINNKQLPPYIFKHIVSPQPSRELHAGEESQTLGDIDLAPSATLVLVPVKGYTDAYSGEASGGVVGAATGLVGGAFGLLSSTVGFVGSTIGSVIGYGAAPAQQQREQTRESSGSGSMRQAANAEGSTVRVRTLADQRAREPQQFYNGNQLSTEPRVDDDDDKQS